MNRSSPQPNPLDVVQRWFHAVVTHPQGVGGGVESPQAQRLIPMSRHELEKTVLRSARLSAHERLNIYAQAYYARLLECLGESFPILKRLLGPEVFDEFAFEYLQNYPSRCYTLEELGDRFAQFLHETRPDLDADARPPAQPNWPDCLVGLATLEHAIEKVFDGPGTEKEKLLSPDDLLALTPESFASAVLVPAPCLRLLHFRYPVNAFYSLARGTPLEQELTPPEQQDEYIALNRRGYVVRRHELTCPQYTALQSIVQGQTIGRAIEAASRVYPGDDTQMAADLRGWFSDWTRRGFFMSIVQAR